MFYNKYTWITLKESNPIDFILHNNLCHIHDNGTHIHIHEFNKFFNLYNLKIYLQYFHVVWANTICIKAGQRIHRSPTKHFDFDSASFNSYIVITLIVHWFLFQWFYYLTNSTFTINLIIQLTFICSNTI